MSKSSRFTQVCQMWPVVFTALRTYAPYVTLPFAGFIGFLGYNLENWLSDKYTPFNSKYYLKPECKIFINTFTESIEEQRRERLLEEEKLSAAEKGEKQTYKPNVLKTNLSPSLS